MKPGKRNTNPQLSIFKARENNLKELDVSIPHDELTVVTGLSGSGKSSLAFDTIYAEGQRRYIETFSPYTRQFFDKVKKPDLDAIENVRPAIAIQQRTRIVNSRSTVGSMTNINEFLKVIWSNLAEPICPGCGMAVENWEPGQLTLHLEKIFRAKPEKTFLLCAPLQIKKKQLKNEIERFIVLGYSRYFDAERGALVLFEDEPPKSKADSMELLVSLDRFSAADLEHARLRDAVEQAYSLADGVCRVIEIAPVTSRRSFLQISNDGTAKNTSVKGHLSHEFRRKFFCEASGFRSRPARPSLFSYNHPYGACPECRGFGRVLTIDEALVVPDTRRSLSEGALHCWQGEAGSGERKRLAAFCAKRGINMKTPWKSLPREEQELILRHKSKEYCGIFPWFDRVAKKAYKMHVRVFLSKYRTQHTCPLCGGGRLTREALAYQIRGKSLPDLWNMPAGDLLTWLREVRGDVSQLTRDLRDVFKACETRVAYLVDLGLPYVTLERLARTLSGGETQRVNLAAALGSELTSTTFVLDEPSVGLHPRDTERLIRAVQGLRDEGNTLVVVEHDLDFMAAADHIVEIGPKAGKHGGEVVYSGPAPAWQGIRVPPPQKPQKFSAKQTDFLEIKGAHARNLKNFDVEIPLRRLVCITGASGSGKSTLIQEVIKKAYETEKLEQALDTAKSVKGFSHVEQLLLVDQSPLSKTPRANIATYTSMWDAVRELLAETEAARQRALTKSHFSFNVEGGRCPACSGAGFIREDMQFLSDVFMQCELCLGKRFQAPVLEVNWNGANVHEILSLTVEDAQAFFAGMPRLVSAAQTLVTLGLGHLTLGHPLSELSGGEAQRLKLVPFVEKSAQGSALLIFDEPTTGLHPLDIERLLRLFRLLVERGHSILCIEHNLQVIADADWVVDLGPEGGEAGGALLYSGELAAFTGAKTPKNSYTAKYLAEYLRSFEKPEKKQTAGAAVKKIKVRDDVLRIRGATEHNLKNVDVDIPLSQVTALTGVSGSGKSSIAKDIVYAEGQRRYLDCLSPYARQFIKELKKPELKEIINVQPTICVYQHTFQPSKLSTVGTMSEVYNHLRLLYAKVGDQYCPDHPKEKISSLSAGEMAEMIKKLPAAQVRILAPAIKMKKGTHREVFERALKAEISEVRVDGVFINPSKFSGGLEKSKAHSIDLVVGKFNPNNLTAALIKEAVEQALSIGGGTLVVHSKDAELVFSNERACKICKRGFFKADPEDLSFHSKRGACPACHGTGLSAKGGVCAKCKGQRLNDVGRSLRLAERNIFEASSYNSVELSEFLATLHFEPMKQALVDAVLRELYGRLDAVTALGLDYISLNRDCGTLSGGELQRLRLATAMGSPLSGVMYIFDEPSAGLHPQDNSKVLSRLLKLKDQGNSVIVIEHDPQTIMACEHVIDVGPGGGSQGGHIVFNGSMEHFLAEGASLTARMITEKPVLNSPAAGLFEKGTLSVRNGTANNIKALDIDLPLHALTVVGGVSGAGKSSLVHGLISDVFHEGKAKTATKHEYRNVALSTSEPVERVLLVDQKPIGINSRSTPASYLGVWDDIRNLFASTVLAKSLGWGPGFFSYNSGKGRCQTCKGLGVQKLEMSFLPDASMVCEVCNGKRYSDDALSVKYGDRSITDVLALTFEEAKTVFTNHRRVREVLHQACDLGIGYLTLGQPSSTLSGGESQRIKLVAELGLKRKGHTLYLLDEPTTGLHKADVAKLVRSLKQLVELGNSVVVIEHDVDVILGGDYFVEVGPGAGAHGGKVVFKGTPRELLEARTLWGEISRDSIATAPAQKARKQNLLPPLSSSRA